MTSLEFWVQPTTRLEAKTMTDNINDGVGTYDVVLLVETAMSSGSRTTTTTWRR